MNRFWLNATVLILGIGLIGDRSVAVAQYQEPLVIAVMDPLCDRLACDCVKGYAQRKYEHLSKFLESKLNRRCSVVYGESLPAALADNPARPALVIGKYSVVVDGAQKEKLDLQPIAALTGKDGAVTQTGLLVVRQADSAQSVKDLKGYHIFFGPADCDEKNSAIQSLLKKNGIPIPEQMEVCGACSESATKLLAMPKEENGVAVISSYAQPLLEGCGTIHKGDLRVIGESAPVPFVTAFVNSALAASMQTEIREALLDTGGDPELLKNMESLSGFVPFENSSSAVSRSAGASTQLSTPATAAKKK